MVSSQTAEPTDVVEMIRGVKDIVAADMTFGSYDAVAILETQDLNALGRIIVRGSQTLPGMLDTITCFTINPAR